MKMLKHPLAVLAAVIALLLGLASVPVGAAAPAMTPTSDTTCGQSASLAERVCFDRSASRVYVYGNAATPSTATASYAASTLTTSSGYCAPFRSTAAEFTPGVVYGARCFQNTGAGQYPVDFFITASGSPSFNSIVTSAAAIINNLGSNAAYEFVWTN